MKAILALSVLLFAAQTRAQDTNVQETKDEIQVTQPETNKKVVVPKKKNGSNVYNFHFHNNGNKETPPAKKVEEKQPDVKPVERPVEIPLPPLKKAERSSGPQAGLFTMNFLGEPDDVSELKLGIGLQAGFMFLSSPSLFYVAPRLMMVDASADLDGLGDNFMIRDYEGTAVGAGFKVGKMFEVNRDLLVDFGVDASLLAGDLESDALGGKGTYKFNATTLSIYGGPAWQMDHFLFTALLSLGVSNLNVKEKASEDDDFTGLGDPPTSESNTKLVPVIGLSVNVTYMF